ncbi:hypothetical protein WMY93_010257 [Mugilogobius chulae]|uniref:Uncharacterized protein n=1 Tax=Mugilogobius chulae TaxID=88201 RepID=A0AAW0PD47_9GOBI
MDGEEQVPAREREREREREKRERAEEEERRCTGLPSLMETHLTEDGTGASRTSGVIVTLQWPDSAISTNGTKRHVPRGIVIQLTGTEGPWDSLDDSELIFSLDEDYPTISLTKERQLSVNDDLLLHAPPCHVPLSSSTPNSLGNCSGSSFLSPDSSSPTHRPFSNLVKSLSSELEIKEGATLRPKPLLNLVKSISTEISRSEPEISQSKSDSRLNLHLWKQLTQPKNRSNGDSRTAPPSPSGLSPGGEGGKGGFFKMELEDTKRKLSEAVHEHSFSSMFHKIMREESGGSPKHNQKKQPFSREAWPRTVARIPVLWSRQERARKKQKRFNMFSNGRLLSIIVGRAQFTKNPKEKRS